ncbi:Nonribosomal peptide synthetase easA [Dirofilaria immitis]
MQRLSSWFEHLSLRHRRSSRRSKNCCSGSYLHKRQSKSVASRFHYSVSPAQNYDHHDNSVDTLSQSLVIDDQLHVIMPSSWNRQETVAHSCRDNSKLNASFLHQLSAPTGSGRKNIRTNPWISRSRPMIQTITYQLPKSTNELIDASTDRTASFRIKNLDESIYSSGYGSQDSSPESSVHSPDWQPSITSGQCGRLEDKAVECNSTDVDEALGLNLEDKPEIKDLKTTDAGDRFRKNDEHAFSQLSSLLNNRTCSSESEIASSSDGSLHSSRCLSPIYIQPNQDYYRSHYCCYQREGYEVDQVTEYPNVASSFTYIPCAKYRSPPEFHPPPPPSLSSPLSSMPTKDPKQAEMDFLSELDAQIADLQLKSIEVCQLVDEVRVRRNARVCNAQLYHELAELRRMKWVLHNHFEILRLLKSSSYED